LKQNIKKIFFFN